MKPPPEVLAYYERFAEETRLQSGASRLELERTKEILSRVLPKPPARVVDVGGAAGGDPTMVPAQRDRGRAVDPARPPLDKDHKKKTERVEHTRADPAVGCGAT